MRFSKEKLRKCLRKVVIKVTFEELKTIAKEFLAAEKNYKEYRDKVLGPVWVDANDKKPIKVVTKEQILKIKELHKISDAAEQKMLEARFEFIQNRS